MIKNPSLHSSISSTNSEKLPKKKINFIEKNKQNLSNKKLYNEDVDVIQINCLNDLNTITRSRDTNPSPISSSSIEIFEQIETIETNDPSYLIQGGQNFEIDDNVYISSNNHYDKSKIRSEFSKLLKKREITPNIIETTTSSIDSGLETMTLKAQSDLDLKLNSVMKQLEVLKLYEQNIVPKLLEKRLESNEFDSSRIKHIEQVQENQFKLMSQLIEKIKPLNSSLNNIEEPRVKTIQFNDKIQVMETNRKSSKSKSRSRSRGSRKKDNSCEVCIKRSKSPPVKKEKQFLQELIETLPKSPNCSFKEDDLLKEKVNYFDDYLTRKNTENLSEILKQSNELLSELERQEEIKSNRVKEEMVKKANKPSMFSDIKDILKKVEISKNKIDTFMNEIDRKKNTKMFYLLNENEDEELRIKKLVDGCINAISNDVQKVVTQKMIDESRHIKLEAEKDINSKSKNRNSRLSQRSVSTTNLTNVKKPKQISDVHKFLGKIYGKSLLDQIKQEEIEEKKQRLKQDNQQQQQQQQKKEPINQKQQQMILNRPAFSTVQFQAYPENTIKKFNYKSTDNISMITIIPREKSQEKVSNMTRQVLPSMSINPAKLNTNNNKKINVKTIEIKENFDESEKEEQGSGIELTGHGKEETKQNDILPTITEPVNQNFFIDRALRENRVLDWLEQEILKSFLNRIRIEDQEQEDNEEYNEQDDLSEEIDRNLIECLTNEVLHEKIMKMMNEYLDDDLDKNKPKLTPRKSMEFTEKKFDIEITTPQCTPPQSPKPPPQIQNQTKDEEEKNEFNFYELIQDETESILDVSLDDTEIQFEDNVTNSKSILIPPTPKETPNPTPEPPETPSLSEVNPPPLQPRPISPQQPRQPSPPPPPQKILISSSVQCDPEPVPIQKIHNQPLIESKSESELTDSSSDFSESSTTLETEKIDSETSESYFSDGAWLMSKSEGEIIRHNHNDYVNLDLQLATKGMIMNPRKNSDITQSEGEIKLDKLNSDQLKAYSGQRARPGVNLIQKERELGEKSDGEVEEKTNINKINESFKVKSKSKKIVSLSVSPEKGNKNKIQIKPLVNEHVVRDSNDFERKIFSSTPDTSLLISNNNNNNKNDKFLGSQILIDSYEMQLSSNYKIGRSNMRDSVFISTDFNTTKIEDEDNDDTLNNTSDLDDK